MSYNGSGTFVINSTGQPVVTATVISSTVFNAFTADIATGLTNCITKDGQQTVTANIPWNSNKITGLGVATTSGDALSYGQPGNMTTLMLTNTLTAADSGTWSSSGIAALTKLGIGMTPSNILDVLQSTNGAATAQISNPNVGSSATVNLNVTNGAQTLALSVNGTGHGNAGVGFITSTNSLDISTTAASSFIDVIAQTNGVQLNNAGTSWSSLSDYRAKNIHGPFIGAGHTVDAVPVHLAEYREEGKRKSTGKRAMFLAHEIQIAVPYAVCGEKDGPQMQMLESTDPLVPILWAALQETRAELRELAKKCS